MVVLAIYGDDNPRELPYMAGSELPRFVDSMSPTARRAVSALMGHFEKPLITLLARSFTPPELKPLRSPVFQLWRQSPGRLEGVPVLCTPPE